MSTASPGSGLRRGTSASTHASAARESGQAIEDHSPEALAGQAVAFSAAFERWTGRKAMEAGASIPRLHLMYAIHCHGPRKMVDLAEALMVTPRNVTALVDGLEAEGLVRRVPHSTDRRVTLVELACESSQVAGQFRTYQASVAGLFEKLDDADRLVLARILRTLNDRIRAEHRPTDGDTPDA
jgi:DNA-binding MarR family transcriptional regulator